MYIYIYQECDTKKCVFLTRNTQFFTFGNIFHCFCNWFQLGNG